MLEKQLVLKGVIAPEEWNEIKQNIRYDFQIDNHFDELKTAEILQNRLQILRDIDEYTGKYYSEDWVRQNVLMMNEDEIEKMKDQIADESESDEEGGEDDVQDDGSF